MSRETVPKIVTLAQLALLPIGTVVSPVVVEDGKVVFDCQGTMRMHPKATLTGKGDTFLDVTEDLPDVRIVEGRVRTYPSEHSYGLPGNYPHRFVVWNVPETRS